MILLTASALFFRIEVGFPFNPRLAIPAIFWPIVRGEIVAELLPELASVAPDCGPLFPEFSLNCEGFFSVGD